MTRISRKAGIILKIPSLFSMSSSFSGSVDRFQKISTLSAKLENFREMLAIRESLYSLEISIDWWSSR
jgi:hypothetical protein